jgi:hypothetical protein
MCGAIVSMSSSSSLTKPFHHCSDFSISLQDSQNPLYRSVGFSLKIFVRISVINFKKYHHIFSDIFTKIIKKNQLKKNNHTHNRRI